MKTIYTIALASIAITGCSSSEAAITTVDVAPPTPAPTTTMIATTTTTSLPTTTTTAPPTTAAPTTEPLTPEQIITDRHLAFGYAVDNCAITPSACDPLASFTPYVSPDSEQYKFYSDGIDKLAERGKRVIHTERIIRDIVRAEIGEDGTTGHTVNCVQNGSIYLESNDDTIPTSVNYGREDFFWELIDGEWIATSGILEGLPEDGDGECSF